MVCLYPVLQVGVNPPGTKTSFSLPLRRDHSIALVIPHYQGSRALEARTHSVLSSRITCSPTVCTVLLRGGKMYMEPCLEAGLAFLPGLLEVGEMDGRHMSDRRVGPPTVCCTCASWPSHPLGYSCLLWIVTHCWVRKCQFLIDSSMAWTEGKNNHKVA